MKSDLFPFRFVFKEVQVGAFGCSFLKVWKQVSVLQKSSNPIIIMKRNLAGLITPTIVNLNNIIMSFELDTFQTTTVSNFRNMKNNA